MWFIDVTLSSEGKGIFRLVHNITNQKKPDQGEKEKNTGRTVLKLRWGMKTVSL